MRSHSLPWREMSSGCDSRLSVVACCWSRCADWGVFVWGRHPQLCGLSWILLLTSSPAWIPKPCSNSSFKTHFILAVIPNLPRKTYSCLLTLCTVPLLNVKNLWYLEFWPGFQWFPCLDLPHVVPGLLMGSGLPAIASAFRWGNQPEVGIVACPL